MDLPYKKTIQGNGFSWPFLSLPLMELVWYGIAFSIVLALGLANLFYPFGSDQAVFLMGAKAMDQGATLYVDYWDNKQPGLYYFYYIGGRLFGFTEYGIHLFELLWLLAFSIILMLTLRNAFQARWLSALVPVATIGVYYATAGEHELTQLEILSAFPIYLSAWCVVKGCQSKHEASIFFVFSGLFAGIAVIFKLLLAPIFVVMWLVATAYLVRERGQFGFSLILRIWLKIAVGVIIPLLIIVAMFRYQNALENMLWTAFTYPPLALETSPPASKSRLVTAAAFFISYFAPWALFAGIAVVAWFSQRGSLLKAMMLAWLVVAAILFLIQKFSWWQYHMLLFFVPAGILAVYGIDLITRYFSRASGSSKNHAMICSALIAIPLCASLTGPFLKKAQPLLSKTLISGRSIQVYQWEVSENYKPLWLGTRFLNRPGAQPGPIYSFGSAMVYEFTGRKSAHKTAGSSWEYYLPEQLEDIMQTLEQKRVPYVFVDSRDYKIYDLRPEVTDYLMLHYKRLKMDESGTWFERL